MWEVQPLVLRHLVSNKQRLESQQTLGLVGLIQEVDLGSSLAPLPTGFLVGVDVLGPGRQHLITARRQAIDCDAFVPTLLDQSHGLAIYDPSGVLHRVDRAVDI